MGDTRARCLGVVFDGRAQATGIRKRRSDATMLLIVNAHHDVVLLRCRAWRRDGLAQKLIDTNLDHVEDEIRAVRLKFGHVYNVTGRSLLLFEIVAFAAAEPDSTVENRPEANHRPPWFQPSKQPAHAEAHNKRTMPTVARRLGRLRNFATARCPESPIRERRPNTNGGAGDRNDGALPPTNAGYLHLSVAEPRLDAGAGARYPSPDGVVPATPSWNRPMRAIMALAVLWAP